MTVKELIKALEKLPEDKVVVLSDGLGWDNVGEVKEYINTVSITMCGNPPFED